MKQLSFYKIIKFLQINIIYQNQDVIFIVKIVCYIFESILALLDNIQVVNYIMVHASILKPIAQIAFFLQYYCILLLLAIKNLFVSAYSHYHKHAQIPYVNPLKAVHPDVFLHSYDLIAHDDYIFQTYEAETSDHAFVTLWRIRLKDQDKRNCHNPVLIQHGLLDCSMSWFLHRQKNNCLPFVLANQGYDVWVGNNRGTVFSTKGSEKQKYWEFNLDHFVKYDQPALIQKILQQTQKEQLIYIGHSQGSTQFLLSQQQNFYLRLKVSLFIGMGTVTSFSNLSSHRLLSILSTYRLIQILQFIGFKSILSLPSWMSKYVSVLMTHFNLVRMIIMNFIVMLCGQTIKNNIDLKRLEVLVAHQPGGTSVQSVKHWIQAYRSGNLRKFDYGKTKNMLLYKQPTPPEYTFTHLKNLPFKSHIFRGKKDAVISEKDFLDMVQYFDKTKIQVYQLDDYAHLDYAWSMTAKSDIYDKIVDILKEDNQQFSCIKRLNSQNTLNTSLSSGDLSQPDI